MILDPTETAILHDWILENRSRVHDLCKEKWRTSDPHVKEWIDDVLERMLSQESRRILCFHPIFGKILNAGLYWISLPEDSPLYTKDQYRSDL